MFQFVLLTCVVASASAAGPASLSFDSWTRHHAKSYATKADADRAAKQFEANAALVAAHNSKASASYTLTVNGKFADMSFDDFSARYLQASQNCSATHRGSPPLSKLREDPPESVDWRGQDYYKKVSVVRLRNVPDKYGKLNCCQRSFKLLVN